jgi:hypothetical protein
MLNTGNAFTFIEKVTLFGGHGAWLELKVMVVLDSRV